MTIILVGKQASGKSSVASELKKIGYTPILECTTREKRPGEEDGTQYHFVTEDEYNALDLITDSKFPTVGGVMSWGLARKDLICEDDSNHIIITYPAACKKILAVGIKDCIVVCLYADRRRGFRQVQADYRERRNQYQGIKSLRRRKYGSGSRKDGSCTKRYSEIHHRTGHRIILEHKCR